MDEAEREQIDEDFAAAINMTPAELEKWLESDGSRSVGYVDGQNKSGPRGEEAVGHAMGRHIVEIKRKKKSNLTDNDYAHMKKAIGYVHRHMAQKPKGDLIDTRWRHLLMNWGHDPEKNG